MSANISMVSADDRDWNPHTSVRIYVDGDVSVIELSCGCVMRCTGLPDGACSCGKHKFTKLHNPDVLMLPSSFGEKEARLLADHLLPFRFGLSDHMEPLKRGRHER